MFNVNASEFKPSWMQDEPDPIPKAPVKEAAKEPAVMSKPLKATESGHDSEVAITEELKSTKNTNEKSESEKLESGETIDPELEDELAKELAAEQEAAESDTEALERGLKELKVLDDREHVNIVFIGHVDAGKSTLSGQILVSCGMVDQRLIEKYEREAVEKNRETWYLAYIMDVNEEERQKGKTVEVGKGSFETAKKRYTILDAPGHKSFVPNMIGGASQADIGILVISAKKGEFEAGFERGGQTREHAMLAKTLGISKLIVVINKMDDPSVEWSKERFDDITEKLSPYLKQVGYNVKKNVIYVPLSGYTGENIKNRVESKTCPWYEGKSLLDELDDLPPLNRDEEGALRLPIVDSYKFQGGVHVLGKLETGTLKINQKLIIQPIGLPVQVTGIIINENEVEMARPGENLTVALKGVEDGQIHSGFVLSSTEDLCPSSQKFDAKIVITELLLHKPLMTKGYSGILHIHSATIECEIVDIMREYNKKTGKVAKKRPPFIKSGAIADVRIELENSVCMEPFEVRAQLGRFTIRDEGKTVAIGKINRIQNIEKE